MTNQKEKEGDVSGWTYCSENLQRILRITSDREPYFSEESGYAMYKTGVYSIQENYFDVILTKYYKPNEIEDDLKGDLPKVGNG